MLHIVLNLALVPFPPIIREAGIVCFFGSALIWAFAAREKWKELHNPIEPTALESKQKKSLPFWAIIVLLIISLAFGLLVVIGLPGG